MIVTTMVPTIRANGIDFLGDSTFPAMYAAAFQPEYAYITHTSAPANGRLKIMSKLSASAVNETLLGSKPPITKGATQNTTINRILILVSMFWTAPPVLTPMICTPDNMITAAMAVNL